MLSLFFHRLRTHGKYALWVPLYLVVFFAIERLVPKSSYFVLDLPIDRALPFCEWFIIPYVFWYAALAFTGVYTLYRCPAAFRRYMRFLSITYFFSALVWLVFPNAQTLRPEVFPRNNLLTDLVSFLYRIDTNTNVFPSVHVAGAVGIALAWWDCPFPRRRCLVRCAAILLAAAICLSTLLLKQHSLLDLCGGLLVSLVAGLWVYGESFHTNT